VGNSARFGCCSQGQDKGEKERKEELFALPLRDTNWHYDKRIVYNANSLQRVQSMVNSSTSTCICTSCRAPVPRQLLLPSGGLHHQLTQCDLAKFPLWSASSCSSRAAAQPRRRAQLGPAPRYQMGGVFVFLLWMATAACY
jgi:hypothetical protein